MSTGNVQQIEQPEAMALPAIRNPCYIIGSVRMPRRLAFRTVAAYVVVPCILLVSIALACGAHEHSASHCCDFCHLGYLPLVQFGGTPKVLPPHTREWRPSSDESGPTVEHGIITSSSRAPPSC